MIRKDLASISDEEFDEIIEPIDDKIVNELRDKLIDEFIAYYLNEHYKANALWNEPLKNIIHGAIDGTLSQFRLEDCNIERMKKILEDKYKLKITNEEELDIEEIS